jgi:hypothetical protein
MQPDLPAPGEPGRSPFDDLRERLARLPASHPSAPGYRDRPDDTEPDARAGADPPDVRTGPGTRAGADPPAEADDAGEPDGTGEDDETTRAGPGGPDSGRGPATQRPGRGGRPVGTAVGYLPAESGDGRYRPWFTGEPPRPWFSDDPPAGRSG